MFYKIYFICLLICVSRIGSEVSHSSPDEQKVAPDDSLKTIKITDDNIGLSVNESLLPPVRQGKETLRNMCIKNAGNESYNRAEESLNKIKLCLNEIIGFAELPSRVEKAKLKGELDIVFKDYCSRTDELKGCIVKFLADVEPCLAENQKSSKYTFQNISEAILHFACEYEGDHIALFVSEEGPQCILDQQPGIEECVRTRMNDTKTNQSFDEWAASSASNDNENSFASSDSDQSLTLNFELEQCRTAYEIRKCVIRELMKCKGSTPANVVESIFNLVQKSTTCSKYTQKELDVDFNGASGLPVSSSMFSVIIPAFTILLVRFRS